MDDELPRILNRVYFFLKFRPRSEREVERYLAEWGKKRGWTTDQQSQVVVHLKERNLINDQEFVEWFVEQRSLHKPKGERALRMELMRYGIPKDIIDGYFSKSPPDEEMLAQQALASKWKRYTNFPYLERAKKAYSYLARKGFSFAIIKKTVAKMEGNE